MPGSCQWGCQGTLAISGVALNGPAWDVPNLVKLWAEADVRGENKVIPGMLTGVRGNPRRLTATEFDLAFVIRGDVLGPAGTVVAADSTWGGLEANLAYLWTNVFAPVTTGRGVRSALLTLPSGTIRTADVQVEPLHFVNDPADPAFVESTIHLTVVSGRFV